MKNWKILSRKTVLDQGKYLRVENHALQLPDGQVIEDWPWIITPDFVSIVAVTKDEQYLLFEQDKYSIEGLSLAPAGGYVEPGEEPLIGAKRELREETGYEAPVWHSLGSYPVDGNRGVGIAHIFLALEAEKVGEIDADDLEEQKLLHYSEDQVKRALSAAQFKVLPWATAFALALHYKNQELAN